MINDAPRDRRRRGLIQNAYRRLAYRPLWLALGTIGADLMLAVLISSALRRRLGYKAWRSVHLLSAVGGAFVQRTGYAHPH